MRPRIHGWIISLLLVGAGGLALGAFLAHDRRQTESSSPTNQITGLATLLGPRSPEQPADRVIAHGPAVPAGRESLPASDSPRVFDSERFAAAAKRSEIERRRESDKLNAATEPPQALKSSQPVAAQFDAHLESVIQVAYESNEPTSEPNKPASESSEAAPESSEPAQRAEQDLRSKRASDQKPVSQYTRPPTNTAFVATNKEVRRMEVPEPVWAVLGPRGGFRPQDVRLIQAPEGQVPANIGQVDVQALDQLGVVILRGSPQDVEAMKKIIEEIQRISEGVEPYIRVFQLHRAAATQVRDKLQELYSGSTASTSSAQRTTTGGQPATTGQGAQAPAATSVVQTPALRRFQLAADDRSNTLIVLASPQMMEELAQVIERLDADGAPAVNTIRIFPLKNGEAQEIANILTQAISGQAAGTAGETIGGAAATVSGGGEVRLSNRSAVLKFMPAEGQGRTIESGILDEVRVTAVIRTNSVIVSAPESSMPLLASIIAELDQPPALVATMKVFELQYADATNMRITLSELFDLEPTTTGGALGGAAGALGAITQQFQRPMAVAVGESPPVSIRIAVDERTNSLIVSGPENAVLQVQAVIRTLDLSDIHNRKVTTYRLKNSYAIDVAATLTQFFTNKRTIEGQAAGLTAAQGTIVGPFSRLEQDVVVVALDNSLAATLTTAASVTSTAVPNTQGVSNMLLISASPRYYDQVIKMIEELDTPQPQVMIQCIIAQLTLNDDFEFGIEFGLQNDVLFDRGTLPFTSTSTLTNTTAGATTVTNNVTGVMPGTPGFNFNSTGPLGNTTAARTAQVGNQGLSSFALGRASLIDGLGNVGGLVLTASSKNISAMLRALQNDGRLEVLSRPQIMTLDGRTARVVVGESFPYIGTVDVSGASGAIIPSVSFANIGVILTVKPNITPDDRIYLEIVPEVSELKEIVNVQQIATSTGTLNQQAPRITQTTANTVVSVNDGQTVVLGGLIQKRQTDFTRKIPWLGDLPCVGFLFRFQQQRELRQELLIIMTPHIVRTEADAQQIKDLEVARVNWVLNHTPEMHGDLGVTQPACEDEVDSTVSDPGMQVIQPMSGEEPAPQAPADWAIPAQPAPGSSKGDKQRTWGGKIRRVFRRSEKGAG